MSRKLLQLSRKFSSNRALMSSLSEPLTTPKKDLYIAAYKMWKKIFFFVAVPATALCLLNTYLSEEPERPEFVKYPYMRIRRNKFPWRDGVKTLFHNPHTNPLPDGYEDQLNH